MSGRANAQEHHNSPIDSHHILIGKASHARTGPRFRNRRDLIDRQPADCAESIAFIWLHRQPKQRSIGGIGRESTNRDGVRPVESVVLQNHDRPGFPGIVFCASSGPDFTTLHWPLHSDTPSINFWSSFACRLLATASDCRCLAEQVSLSPLWKSLLLEVELEDREDQELALLSPLWSQAGRVTRIDWDVSPALRHIRGPGSAATGGDGECSGWPTIHQLSTGLHPPALSGS